MWSVHWELKPEDFLTFSEVRRLRNSLSRKALQCRNCNRIRIIEYMIIEVGLQTGLRVSELSELQCGDIVLNGTMSFVKVRNGKGGIPGIVRIGKELIECLKWFFEWKKSASESMNGDSPVFVSSHTGKELKKRAIQNLFKRCCIRAGITRSVHVHMLRHTYASILYSKSGHNLRLVQTQLRHKSSRTTEAYASVLNEAYKALDDLYK